MKRIIIFALILFALPAMAQRYVKADADVGAIVRVVTADPDGNACTAKTPPVVRLYYTGAILKFYHCQSSTWQASTLQIGTADILTALELPPAVSEGTCGSGQRYQYKVVTGGSGVADQVVVCLKNESDTYNWVLVADGGP